MQAISIFMVRGAVLAEDPRPPPDKPAKEPLAPLPEPEPKPPNPE